MIAAADGALEISGSSAVATRRRGLPWLMRMVSRSILIWQSVFVQLIKVAFVKRRFATRGERDPDLVEARRRLAAELRDTLIRLGPTFIKVGQLLSTRVDALPPEVIQELTRLQNEVPGFPVERAIKIIERDLGKKVDEIYRTFERIPLAAASLAQVHRATLANGQEVVVKVQREGLRDLIDIDLANINLVAKLADRLDPATEAVASNWQGIADTSGKVLYQEIDFTNEMRSAQEFAANFRGVKEIKVPEVVPELCSRRLITMEYVPGVKITDLEAMKKKGFDMVRLSYTLTTSYLTQICRHGFFHCDPHPGNLAVDDGHPGGRLIYYDFGMMERVEPGLKKGFVDLVFSIYQNAPRESCDAMEAMGILRPGIDRYSIERIAKNILDSFQSTLASADNVWENQMTPEQKKESRRARRQKIGADLFATQAERPFVFPPMFTFVFRAFTTIDGIGKNLNGNYDLARISQPFLRELADLRDGSVATTVLKELGERLGLRPIDLSQAIRQPRNVAKLAATVKKLEEGDLKLRVRALEVERMMEKMEMRQKLYGNGLGAALLYIMSTTTAPASVVARLGAKLLLLGAARLAWETRSAYLGLTAFELQEARFSNSGNAGAYDEQDFMGSELGQDSTETVKQLEELEQDGTEAE